MLNLIITKDDISLEYEINNNFNKELLNNTNNIILQDNNKTMIVNIENNSKDLFSKITDMIINTNMQSVDQVKEYLDLIVLSEKSNNTILDNLQVLLEKSNLSYEIIASIETEAGDNNNQDSSFYTDDLNLTNSQNHNLTNRSQLDFQDGFLNQNINRDNLLTNNESNGSSGGTGGGSGGTGGGAGTPLTPIILNARDTNGDASEVLLNGTGQIAGNSINIFDSSNNLIASTIVLANNTWNVDISSLSSNQRYTLSAQENNGTNSSSSSNQVTVVIATTHITNQSNDDYIFSGDGFDYIFVQNDDANNSLHIDGGNGDNIVSFENNTNAINIDLNNQTHLVGDDNITFENISHVFGSKYNDDTIIGDDQDNYIHGKRGNDTIHGGAGNDYLVGDDGALHEDNNDDTLYGGEGNDTLAGGYGADKLYGGIGNDSLHGQDGDDILEGGAGDDMIRADGGVDTAIFSGNVADYCFTIYSNFYIKIKDLRPGSPDGEDTVLHVEKYQFADGIITYLDFSSQNTSTPLIIDLNSDGVKTISVMQGVNFDIDADGDVDKTAWVDKNDGLLVRDINKDGIINDGRELFGEETIKEDGTKAKDGFDALRELDSNNDGVINKEDEAFEELRVWRDSNSDGITDEGELLTLKEAGVVELSVKAEESDKTDNGNTIGLTGTYTKTNGETSEISDVWFAYEENKQNESINLESIKNSTLNLKNEEQNLLKINFDNLLDVLDDNNELTILGDNQDSLILEGGIKTAENQDGKWELKHQQNDEDGNTYNIYESFNGDSLIKLLIEDSIDINNI